MKCWDKNYLVTVDYYSIFWEIDYVENTLSSTIINKLRSHFSRHGIPILFPVTMDHNLTVLNSEN